MSEESGKSIISQIEKYMGQRFGSTPFPSPTIDQTKDNEGLTQWYLETAFFRDFVYRNPDKSPGKEFSDALILYDDTLIIVQNKTQQSMRDPLEWAKKNLNAAARQLKGSYRNLAERIVTSFANDFIGSSIEVRIEDFKTVFGVIVVAHESPPYDPYSMIETANSPDCPINVVSLNDLLRIADRMDTAANLITYFEFRFDCMNRGFVPFVNDEAANMEHIAGMVPEILEPRFSDLDPEKCEASIRAVVRTLRHRIKDSPDYVFGTLVDDAVARAHDTDPSWSSDSDNSNLMAHEIASRIGWLDRTRRIAIGRRLLAAAAGAKQGAPQIRVHIQKKTAQIYVWVFTGESRKDRTQLLQLLCAGAQIKYGFERVLGIATEPANGNGRSYDYYMADEYVIATPDQSPADVLSWLPAAAGMGNLADEI